MTKMNDDDDGGDDMIGDDVTPYRIVNLLSRTSNANTRLLF